jgi:1,2-diacylglycerol 3-alpha-glucosyltransferase
MHIVVLFESIGNYHATRLQATDAVFQRLGWQLTAIQITDRTKEHPWGGLEHKLPFQIKTLVSASTSSNLIDHYPDSPAAAALLPKTLDELEPDVVAIPGWGFRMSRAALRWSNQHRKVAILMSDSKWDDVRRSWWKEQLKSWLYVRKYDAALVAGQLHRDYLIKLGFPSDRIFLGYDVVDNDYFAQCADVARQDPGNVRRRQPNIPAKPYFLAVTRFIQRKNVSRLVDAYAAYSAQIGKDAAWDLVICGSGVEEPAIRRLIGSYHLNSDIHLPGFLTYQEIGDWYGLAHAFIHPALQEQWGLVVNEACAAGLPILCSQTAGVCPELVQDGCNGFIFDPTNTQDLTRTLVAIHQLDAASRQEFGQLSQKIVANYSPLAFAEGLMSAVKAATAD